MFEDEPHPDESRRGADVCDCTCTHPITVSTPPSPGIQIVHDNHDFLYLLNKAGDIKDLKQTNPYVLFLSFPPVSIDKEWEWLNSYQFPVV